MKSARPDAGFFFLKLLRFVVVLLNTKRTTNGNNKQSNHCTHLIKFIRTIFINRTLTTTKWIWNNKRKRTGNIFAVSLHIFTHIFIVSIVFLLLVSWQIIVICFVLYFIAIFTHMINDNTFKCPTNDGHTRTQTYRQSYSCHSFNYIQVPMSPPKTLNYFYYS